MKTCKNPNCTKTIQPSSHKKIFCSRSCANYWHNNVCGKWQPIKTAPKDGTRILIYDPKFRAETAVYGKSVWGEIGFINSLSKSVMVCIFRPSHWMPITPLPKT